MAHEEELLGKAYDARLMKRLLKYLRPYKWQVTGAIVVTLFISLLGPLRPYLIKVAIDDYIVGGKHEGLWKILIFLVAIKATAQQIKITGTVKLGKANVYKTFPVSYEGLQRFSAF